LNPLAQRSVARDGDVEDIVDRSPIAGGAVPDRLTEALGIKQLVKVVASAEHRKILAATGEIAEQLENPETFGADEGFWAQHRETQTMRTEVRVKRFGLNFGLDIGQGPTQI